MKRSGDILEYDNQSRSIEHSIEKGVFVDTLRILNQDTIPVNAFKPIDLLPTSAWIEKVTYWKSGVMDMDSVGFMRDTVLLIVTFENFVNGKQWKPESGYHVGSFQDDNGNEEGVYVDSEISRLHFRMHIDQVKDTVSLTTKDEEETIILTRARD